jgi:uridine kinase
MENLYSNKTIQTDNVTNIDILDRKRFAKEIAANILQHFKTTSESLVIGIHGAWGSGKSTLLDFIKKEIEQSKASISVSNTPQEKKWYRKTSKTVTKENLFILEFNPWMFSGKEQLHWMFLNEFAIKVQNKKHKLRSKIEAFAKGIHWLDNINNLGAATRNSILKFSEISVDKLKRETNEVLIKENIYTIIIIDDIDRLAPAEILEIFQLIKLNANFSNTLFLISFDKMIVSSSINSEFKLDGEKYLEKIIQVDYSLPSILPEEIESMFFKRLEIFLDENKIQFDLTSLNAPWLIDGLKHYFHNIRDLNRYFNSISFRLPTIYEEINIHDFLIIEAIRLFDFNAYEIIKNNFKEARQFGDQSHFRNKLNEIQPGKTFELFKYLFEKGQSYSTLKENKYRISDSEFFDRYFSLSISKKDMREEEFRNFILHPPTRFELLNTIISEGKIEFLLRRLTTISVKNENSDIISTIPPLISVWANHHIAFMDHWRNVWDAIKSIILMSGNAIEGYRKLIQEVTLSTSDFSPARFVFNWLLIQNINKEDEKTIDHELVSFTDLLLSRKEAIQRSWFSMLENHQMNFFNGNGYGILYQRIFLPSFAKYHTEKYHENFRHIIKDDQKVFMILDMLVFRDSKTKKPFGVDTRHINTILPQKLKDEFDIRMRTINLKVLSLEDAATVETYLEYVKENKSKSQKEK